MAEFLAIVALKFRLLTLDLICTIILPGGSYRYKRMPIGRAIATDIFQHFMSKLMQDLECCRVYLDDLLCITRGTFEEHLKKHQLVFERLTKANLKINDPKSNFCTQRLEYIGYLLTPKGIKPLTNKIKAIIRMKRFTTLQQLRSFLGMANFCRDS